MSQNHNTSRACENCLPYTTGVIVKMYGLKADTVKKVKAKRRSDNTELGETIAKADALLKDGFARVIADVKARVPYNKSAE